MSKSQASSRQTRHSLQYLLLPNRFKTLNHSAFSDFHRRRRIVGQLSAGSVPAAALMNKCCLAPIRPVMIPPTLFSYPIGNAVRLAAVVLLFRPRILKACVGQISDGLYSAADPTLLSDLRKFVRR